MVKNVLLFLHITIYYIHLYVLSIHHFISELEKNFNYPRYLCTKFPEFISVCCSEWLFITTLCNSTLFKHAKCICNIKCLENDVLSFNYTRTSF